MNRPSSENTQPLGLGVASVVLGVISTLLFFLPILATPIALIALTLAVIGCALGMTSGRTSLRWSAVGLVVSGLALTINLAIAYAPSGFEHTPPSPPPRHLSPPPVAYSLPAA